MRDLIVGVGVVLLLVLASLTAGAQTYVPIATVADHILAALEVSKDGRTVTIRGQAPDHLRVCVAPAVGVFGPTRCFVVEDIRKGSLTLR